MSPTQRSLAELRKRGYMAAITEHWNSFARIRQDLYGFIDLVGIKADVPGVLAVQTTSGSNASARLAKIKALPVALVWLQAGNAIVVHAWRKVGARGKRKLWELREVSVLLVEVTR